MHRRYQKDAPQSHGARPKIGHLEEEAGIYLLDIPHKTFQLHIKATNILSSSTNGDGSFGFRALRQASKRATIPDNFKDNMQIRDVDYKNTTGREAQIAWAETIISVSAPDADFLTMRIYVEWLKIPVLPETA